MTTTPMPQTEPGEDPGVPPAADPTEQPEVVPSLEPEPGDTESNSAPAWEPDDPEAV